MLASKPGRSSRRAWRMWCCRSCCSLLFRCLSDARDEDGTPIVRSRDERHLVQKSSHVVEVIHRRRPIRICEGNVLSRCRSLGSCPQPARTCSVGSGSTVSRLPEKLGRSSTKRGRSLIGTEPLLENFPPHLLQLPDRSQQRFVFVVHSSSSSHTLWTWTNKAVVLVLNPTSTSLPRTGEEDEPNPCHAKVSQWASLERSEAQAQLHPTVVVERYEPKVAREE